VASAPANGALNTVATAQTRLITDSAAASSAFCSGRGDSDTSSQMFIAKPVSALPKTETDWVAHTMEKVRKPFGGGV
jgi:hypothetical protein